jgi:hypothetical protein
VLLQLLRHSLLKLLLLLRHSLLLVLAVHELCA